MGQGDLGGQHKGAVKLCAKQFSISAVPRMAAITGIALLDTQEQWQLTMKAAELYERYPARYILGPWAPLLVDAARVGAGERVLDVACGTGVVARAAGLEEGVVSVSDRGTGQGSVISPLLANIYLHYALDLGAARWRRRKATGDMIIVRYADDFIVGFQHHVDARCFLDEMRERLREFALSLHPEKTRLIEFGT